MDSRLAKEILLCYRPGTADPSDPEFAEALEQAKRDPELGRWFSQHQALHITLRDRFKQLPVPAGLKQEILAGYRSAVVPVWWQQPAFQALAAAAAIMLLIGVALFCWTHERQRIEDVIEQAGTTDERIALSILRDLIDDSRLLPKAA